MNREASYSINYAKDNPFALGIYFMIAGLVIGFFFVLFPFLIYKGVIVMSTGGVLALVSIFSGLLTWVLVYAFTIPIFKTFFSSEKVQAVIVDVKKGETHSFENDSGRVLETFTPVVEYNSNGKKYRKELLSSSSVCPEIGKIIVLRVNKKNPKKIVTAGNVGFAFVMAFVFTVAGVLFALPGIRILLGKSSLDLSASPDTSAKETMGDPGLFIMIGGGLALLFFLIGLGACVIQIKKLSAKKIRESGVKKEALIVSVDVTENFIINGENPVKLSCSVDGKIYTVKTRCEVDKCRFHEGEKIDMYFSPNGKKYSADLGE